jgi:hypothetical protein
MSRVRALTRSVSAASLYRQFKNSYSAFEASKWYLAVFEGSPCEGMYSWCSDCNVAYPEISRFATSRPGNAKFLQFKVGTKEQWESKITMNPFRLRHPNISDLPTAILFRGKQDVARIVAPNEGDLRYLCQRAEIYETQIRSRAWHPPSVFRKIDSIGLSKPSGKPPSQAEHDHHGVNDK